MLNTKISLVCKDSLDYLRTLETNSLDCVVTDPPYGLTTKQPDILKVLEAWTSGKPFMVKSEGILGSSWDSLVPGPELWREVYRVLKPGAHMAVFSSPRTQDLLGIALRISGFEIRDTIAWLRKGGMPKSTSLSLMVDKKLGFSGNRGAAFSVAGNGTQASMEGKAGSVGAYVPEGTPGADFSHMGTALKPSQEPILIVRKPLSGSLAENALEWNTGGMDIVSTRFGTEVTTVNTHSGGPNPFGNAVGKDYSSRKVEGKWLGNAILEEGYEDGWLNGSGDLSKFFLVAKAHKKEKEAGCENLPKGRAGLGNPHPSPKPIELMRCLVRLLAPKPEHVVIDPFNGSGGTAIACGLENRQYIGVDLERQYIDISVARVAHWCGDSVDIIVDK